jgi:antitoxin component of RelBE/YafQ-DinJ toxin-antitoxin module
MWSYKNREGVKMNHAATVKLIWDTMTEAERQAVTERMGITKRPLVRMALREAEEWDGDND